MKNIEEERSMRSVGHERSMQSPAQERSIQSNREYRSTQSPSSQSPSSIQERFQLPSSPGDVQEAVRVRAYQIYEQRRGKAGGSEMEDWLQAEAEILPSRNRQRAA